MDRMDASAGFEIVARPLHAEAFAPFGRVVEHVGQDRRTYFPDVIEAGATAWVSRVREPIAFPTRIRLMERHPHSTQLFAPLLGQRALVVVCRSTSTGDPDPETLEAFLAEPWQGVSYARNVWHHGLNVLQAPAEFLVAMSVGRPDDDVFFELGSPVTVRLPASAEEASDAA